MLSVVKLVMVAFERDALGFRIEATFTTLTKAATTRARLVMASYGPSDLPGWRWAPLLVLAAQVVRPTVVGWVLVAFPSALYGLLLFVALLRGNWEALGELEGLAWWLFIVASLYVDLTARHWKTPRTAAHAGRAEPV